MTQKILLFIALFCMLEAFAQADSNVEKNQLTLNFLLPGVIYEAGVSENSTLAAEATIGFALRGCSGCETSFGIYPIGRLQYRYYYNLNRRLAKGKRIDGNTGNYIAPTLAAQSGTAIIGDLDFSSRFFGGLGVVYGLQRTAPKGFQLRMEIGPAYYFDEFDKGFGALIALKLGWVIKKNR
jgi:hypothetical protein